MEQCDKNSHQRLEVGQIYEHKTYSWLEENLEEQDSESGIVAKYVTKQINKIPS